MSEVRARNDVLSEASDLHKRAMLVADEASRARALRGPDAKDRFRTAFQLERAAALLLVNFTDLEPSRSVLFRSAASLALDCDEIREAERLVATALAGSPPDDIAEELRDVLEQVYFQRHLALRGFTLHPAEFQLSINGQAVGFGMAESQHFVGRVKDLQTMVYRTAERKLNRHFREHGRRREDLETKVELYLSAPRAASFAVTCRIGTAQTAFPGMPDLAEVVFDEVLDCMELYSDANEEALKERIPDPAYYRNFIGLARNIAPDGEEITTVGLTAIRNDRERRIVVPPRRRAPRPRATPTQPPTTRQIRGVLKFSDSRDERRGLIQIVDDAGTAHKVRVPPGMMRDIVRPMYEDEVVATVRRRKAAFVLDTIDAAPAD